MKVTLLQGVLLAVCLVGAGQTANATLVTIYIEGVVDSVHDYGNYLEGKINVGDPITGHYTYDTSTPDSNPITQVADYEYSTQPYGAVLAVGGLVFRTDPANVSFVLELIDDYLSGGLHDSFGWISYNNLSVPTGLSLGQLSWWLRDDTAAALGGTGLAAGPPVLENWSANDLRIEGYRGWLIDAHISSAVPEPATLSLIGLGALALTRRKMSNT